MRFTLMGADKAARRRKGDIQLRASSAVYLTMTSALSSWKSRRESKMMSPWLIQTCTSATRIGQGFAYEPSIMRRTFFLIFPRMCASRFSPSKHWASRRPLPNILITCAYSWPSSRKTSSRLSSSFSFFPRLRFFPPWIAQTVRSFDGATRTGMLANLSLVL